MQYYFGGLDLAHVWAPHCRSVMGLNLNPEPCTMDLYPELWAWSHQQTSMNQDFKTTIQWLYMWQGSNVSLISWMQHNLPLSLSVYLLACLSLSVCLPACLFSLSLPLSTSHDLSLSHSVSLWLCFSVFVVCGSLSLCLSVCLSLCLSVFTCPCLCPCPFILSLSLSVSDPVYLSLSISLTALCLLVYFINRKLSDSSMRFARSYAQRVLHSTDICLCGMHSHTKRKSASLLMIWIGNLRK